MSVVTRIRTSEEITVPFSPEEIWSVLIAATAYPEWWPKRWPVHVLHEKPGLLGTEIEVRSLVGGSFCFRFEELHEPSAIRFRFFGGAYEGPGGFLIEPKEGGSRVRYDIDVFARGMTTAALSQFVPFDVVHRFHMRSLLRHLSRRVLKLRRLASRAREDAARAVVQAARQAEAAEARRIAEENAARVRAEEAEAASVVEATATCIAAEEAEIQQPATAVESVLSPMFRRCANWLRSPSTTPLPPPSHADPSGSAASGLPDEMFQTARQYLEALSSPSPPEEIRACLASEHLREEYPHRFLDQALSSDLDETLRLRARDLGAFANQRFEIRDLAGSGSQLAIELAWSATVAADLPPFVKGQELAARIASFFKFEDGRIARQRVYTCFEPWSDASERTQVLAERMSRPHPNRSLLESQASPAGSNFEIARAYLAALSGRAPADDIAAFFAPDAIQEELPNRFTPLGAVRTVDDIRKARERGLEFLDSEEYELRGATGSGSLVAMEVRWSGRVAVASGLFAAGQRLEAYVAIFLDFRGGLIVRQTNYDCVPRADSATPGAGQLSV